LRQGAVYQWEKGTGPQFDSEFFWLCPRCSATFDVSPDREGVPSLTPCGFKGEGNQRCSRIKRVLRGVLQECPVAGCPAESAGKRVISVTARPRNNIDNPTHTGG
jgi:hypothetical protein